LKWLLYSDLIFGFLHVFYVLGSLFHFTKEGMRDNRKLKGKKNIIDRDGNRSYRRSTKVFSLAYDKSDKTFVLIEKSRDENRLCRVRVYKVLVQSVKIFKA